MESIFENTTTLTRQNLTELARTTAPKWSWLTGLIPALLAVLAAVWGLVKNGIGLGPGLLLLAAAALLITTFGAPGRVALRVARKNHKRYGCEVTVTLRFYADRIVVCNHQEQTEADLPYSQIAAVRQSRRLYLLVLPGRMALLLEKTAFTQGDPAAFAAFLRRQCPGRVAF